MSLVGDMMFEKMISIAKSKLEDINEEPLQLPSPQVTVLASNNKIYVAINEADGTICEQLKRDKNTKIYKMITMWKDGSIDLPSINLRKALIELNEDNNNTDIMLQGKEGCLIKKLSVTIPV